MRKNLFIVLTVVLMMSAVTLAQPNWWNPGVPDNKVGYLEWGNWFNTRSIPAGTVVDPGSHLTYIVDTGINARKIAGKANLVPADEDDPLSGVTDVTILDENSLLKPYLDADGDGTLDDGAIFQNFIAIANTNPTKAVTVHFRYFNDNCEDLLDFLVVVTCNDTLLFDPFNFVIPQTGGENSRSRMIGPAGAILEPIQVIQWGSGRFVITAAASGTSVDIGDVPEILFPYEWRDLAESEDQHCNMVWSNEDDDDEGFYDFMEEGNQFLFDVVEGFVPNVGSEPGFSGNNLHVFNANQISFNYLIGHLTTAIPKGFIKDSTDVRDAYLAYGTNAWTRPAVDREVQDPQLFGGPWGNRTTQLPDGDSWQAVTGKILWGGEPANQSDGFASEDQAETNHAYLRNEVHGGDIESVDVHAGVPAMPLSVVDALGDDGGWSLYGALGTTPYSAFGDAATRLAQADNSLIHFLSVSDDYNGNNNTANGFGTEAITDLSANISPAATTYVMQIYDSNEHILTFTNPPATPVSPPQIKGSAILKITCICLRTFVDFRDQAGTVRFNGSRSVDDLSVLDLYNLVGHQVLDGLDDFNGMLKGNSMDEDGSFDSSGGWIRFVRDNTFIAGPVPEDTGLGLPADATPTGPGTSTFDDPILADNDDFGPSFLTIGLFVLKFEGFGASWYLHAAAFDSRVSEQGREVPRTVQP